MTTPTSTFLARVLGSFAAFGFAVAAVACASPVGNEAAEGAPSFGVTSATTTARGCASDADCFGGTCVFTGDGELRAGTCSGGNPPGPPGEGADREKDGDDSRSRSCGRVCAGGQLDPSRGYDKILTQSNATISTEGNGSMRIKVIGDNNVITTDGGGTCIFDVYGSNNQIFEASHLGAGSTIVNVLSGTDNTVDFTNVGGCNAVNFSHGTLTVNIDGCGVRGNAINGQPAEKKVYTLP